jgi:DNA-binding transcriptional LysR family regulator
MLETTIDLNLLTALDALLSEQSVSAAAERVNMTTPSMSRALGRLRLVLKDELLVRAGQGMVLTALAMSLRDRVHAARVAASAVLQPQQAPDLSQLEKTFVIRATDAIAGVVLAPLLTRLERDMPRARVALAGEGLEDALALREGRVDIDVGVLDFHEPELMSRTLLSDTFAFAVRRGHALTRRPLSAQRLVQHGHVIVSRLQKTRGPIDSVLEKMGLERKVVAVLPNFLAALMLAAESDAVVSAPKLLIAQLQKRFQLVLLKAPFELPRFSVGMAWHPRTQHDAAAVWLRAQLVDIAKAL